MTGIILKVMVSMSWNFFGRKERISIMVLMELLDTKIKVIRLNDKIFNTATIP